ncbi:hypothetical protein DSO57_1010478 [Entomophthora muscae]|uniref:Uncharacterized protein n=1 Tax=Entomophthora muscae TaxID=34485 RepID=A0ACC2SJF1_9FUNG|nr:hypothetical protein DSO57_1010478 [Entomophthora muscae]
MDSLLNHTKHDLFDQTLMYLLTKLVTRTQRGLVPRRKESSPDAISDSDPDNPPKAAPVIPAKQTGECTPTPRAKLCRVMLDAQIADEPAQPAPNTPPPLIESTTATVATTPVIPHNPEPVLPATRASLPRTCKRQRFSPEPPETNVPVQMRPSLSRACKRPCLVNIPVSSRTPRTCKKAISVCKNTTSHIPMEE